GVSTREDRMTGNIQGLRRLQAGARWRRRSTPPPAAVGGGHPTLSVPEARRQPSTTGSDPPSPNMTPSLIGTGSYRRRTRRSLSERVALLCDAGEELVPGFDERGSALALEVGRERIEVDAGLRESIEHLLGVSSVVRQHRADVSMVGEREKRLVGHRVHR